MCATNVQTEVIHDPYLFQIRSILSQVFRERKCQIYLFGSRATGSHTGVSDFDIAVLASGNVSKELSIARELLETSNIPFTVDLVDLGITSEKFIHQVQEGGILLWQN